MITSNLKNVMNKKRNERQFQILIRIKKAIII